MAVSFFSDDAQDLLDQFNENIDQSESVGKIKTWERSSDREYYTHRSEDWRKKAWFKPFVQSDRLTFYIVKPRNCNVTTAVYGYYHGHLIETFLNHFDTKFSAARATPLPTGQDHCS